ncbi:HAMP domain-containing sensor histidine kinase [Massilia sp. CFBP9012]|uniref:sensor histidine kinase n=1 Tax=Massilia sp. CFBP9012 TaxID=3096531 RepID=UPI002A69F47F|nr:HAMP domain-containing sensor histidine kinase [Massilia sp. CFBP9012]MDY0978025.1 HAMP domain-containing sensor histidine kinase [Massilia sp. CFBP9012]
MNKRSRGMSSLQRKISAVFVLFFLVMALGLTIQGNLSQHLIVHPLWEELLESSTARMLADGRPAPAAKPSPTGLIRGWRLGAGPIPADMPPYFAQLQPGYYDEERMDSHESDLSHAVLVTPVGDGERIVMAVDITDLENYQNNMALVSVLIAVLSGAMIAGSIAWVYRSLRRPMGVLAERMEELDPEQPSQRLATDFALSELHDIAVLVNGHLERVERFIERERSLLDQASHEFRTPIAVIAGAVDVLKLHELPPAAEAPLARIESTAENLTEIMSALLFLSREDGKAPLETTRLDALVLTLIDDHRHLLEGKDAHFVVDMLEPLTVNSPEAIARIVVGNLLRNAAENSYQGAIRVRLTEGRLSIQDSGAGFDTVAAARRYTQALRKSAKQGGGQGLGLFLTRRVCERFGWTLTISSNPAHGTLAEMTFT